jgi:hypothetical protein
VADHIDRVDAEMAADDVQIVDVAKDATFELRRIVDRFGAAPVARVIKDDRAAVGKRREVVDEVEPVRDDDGLWTAPDGLKKQPHVIVCRDKPLAWQHTSHSVVSRNTKAAAQARLLKRQKPRRRGFRCGGDGSQYRRELRAVKAVPQSVT